VVAAGISGRIIKHSRADPNETSARSSLSSSASRANPAIDRGYHRFRFVRFPFFGRQD